MISPVSEKTSRRCGDGARLGGPPLLEALSTAADLDAQQTLARRGGPHRLKLNEALSPGGLITARCLSERFGWSCARGICYIGRTCGSAAPTNLPGTRRWPRGLSCGRVSQWEDGARCFVGEAPRGFHEERFCSTSSGDEVRALPADRGDDVRPVGSSVDDGSVS